VSEQAPVGVAAGSGGEPGAAELGLGRGREGEILKKNGEQRAVFSMEILKEKNSLSRKLPSSNFFLTLYSACSLLCLPAG